MIKGLRTTALAAGLVGLLGNNSLYAHNRAIGDLRYSAPSQSAPSNEELNKQKWRETMDYEGGVFPLENFGKDEQKLYQKYFDLAARHLKESGLKLGDPELVFFDDLKKLSLSADESRVMVVGKLIDSQFSNGDMRYAFNTEGDGKLEYKLSPLFIDVTRVASGEDKAFDLYSSFIKSLAGANLAEKGLPLIRTDRTLYPNDEEFETAYSDSINVWNFATKEVVLCLLQGISMRNGARNGISKKSIEKNLKEYPSLLRRECINPILRRAVINDYGYNPTGLLMKLRDLELRNHGKTHKPN